MALDGPSQCARYLDAACWGRHHDQIHQMGKRVGYPRPSADYGVPYGFAAESSPQHPCTLDDAELMILIKNRMARSAATDYSVPDASLYTQALQIAALESLTNALDYSQLPSNQASSAQQLSSTQQLSPGYADLSDDCYMHPAAINLPFLDLPASVATPGYAERSPSLSAYDNLSRSKASRRQTCAVGARAPQWANANWHPKASIRACPQSSPSKGTGVFLPCTYNQPEPSAQPLRRSLSELSDASKDGASSVSDLSRRDSYQSSETDCNLIASHGLSFTSRLPAGDARRVVGSKVGAVLGKKTSRH